MSIATGRRRGRSRDGSVGRVMPGSVPQRQARTRTAACDGRDPCYPPRPMKWTRRSACPFSERRGTSRALRARCGRRSGGHPVAPAPDRLPRPGGPPQEGRGHAARQRLVGARSTPPDGRLRRPRVGDLPSGAARITRCSCSARSCRGSGSRRRSTTAITSVVGAGADDQADPVPEDRPAGRGDDRPASSTSRSG